MDKKITGIAAGIAAVGAAASFATGSLLNEDIEVTGKYFVRPVNEYVSNLSIDVPDEFTPDNISASIERGGNTVHYKIDGKWFDMLDPKATDGSYFNSSENAVADEVWDAWEIDNFYKN